jgi:hypothetical protein
MNGNDKAARPLADELIWQVADIAAELGLPTRVAYNLLKTRALPAQKVGGKWCTSRSALRGRFKAVLGAETLEKTAAP